MHNRLAYAIRRYERIRPQPHKKATPFKADELADWVERDVCPVVAELNRRPGFQTQVRWPLEHLTPECGSAERQLVESIDNQLVGIARKLAGYANAKALKGTHNSGQSAATVSVGTHSARQAAVTVGSDGIEAPERDAESTLFEEWRPLTGGSLMEFIAGKPWRDLASVCDFFGPMAEMNLTDREAYLGPGTQHVQMGMFLPYCNPRLRPLGDFVSRMLLIRVEHWRDALSGCFSHCRDSFRAEPQERDGQWSAVQHELVELNERISRLRQLLLGGIDAKLREACLALVQIQAAFNLQNDLSWLGEASQFIPCAARYRDDIEHRNNFALAEQIAASLAECAEIYRSNEDSEDVLRQALDRYPLVLVEGPGRREVYWKGEATDEEWDRHSAVWQFLVALAEQAKSQLGVDGFRLQCSVKDARSRIKKLIPEELDSLIRPGGKGTYVLNLAADKVCRLRWEEEDRITAI